MKTKNKIIIFFLIILIIFIIQIIKDVNYILNTDNLTLKDWYWNLSFVKSNSPHLVDNPLLYNDEDTKAYKIYLIILPTKDGEGNKIDFNYLNNLSDFEAEKPELNAYLINTDSKGIETFNNIDVFPIANATITFRGHSTMEAEQKSYKIKMGNSNETYLGNSILNLNKHPFDAYKVRNKIAFELFEGVQDFISMRTNLINLYIKDMTDTETEGFINYGLFTNIEQANTKFLKDHNLDTRGNLYKAEYFEFFRYEDSIRNIDDPLYDKQEFAHILEPKVAKNHVKLIKMLDDINNYNLDINKVLDKHFNRDNYFTWLAINILLDNYDTQTQNYFLYSAHDNLAWYFLPWDYDGSMKAELQLHHDAVGKFQALIGVSNYWNSVLHNRVFREPNNLIELNKKIEEVYSILSKDYIEKVASKYLPIVRQEYESNTIYNHEFTLEEFNNQIELISRSTRDNRKLYYEYIEKPMPIYLGEVEESENGYYFFWDESFDLQGDRLSYTLQVSKTIDFSELVYEKIRYRDTHMDINLEPGEYFWRVIVVDSKGNTQRAFDQFIALDGGKYFGIRKIVIE